VCLLSWRCLAACALCNQQMKRGTKHTPMHGRWPSLLPQRWWLASIPKEGKLEPAGKARDAKRAKCHSGLVLREDLGAGGHFSWLRRGRRMQTSCAASGKRGARAGGMARLGDAPFFKTQVNRTAARRGSEGPVCPSGLALPPPAVVLLVCWSCKASRKKSPIQGSSAKNGLRLKHPRTRGV
jgi:hypothetical protein